MKTKTKPKSKPEETEKEVTHYLTPLCRVSYKKLLEVPFTGYKLKKANGKETTVKEVFADVDVID